MAKTTRITISKTEFEERNGKLYCKILKREEFHDEARGPKWERRFDELRAEKLTYADIADKLNAEGFVSTHGKRLTIDHLRNRVCNRKQK